MIRAIGGSQRIEVLTPSSDWDGTEGSGFAALPSDPERISAKPALRLLTPPGQCFTDTMDIGAIAFANNAGTLIGGVDHVAFHFEGNVLKVRQPSQRTIIDANGVPRSYWGYWAKLAKPVATSGTAQLFVEAVPRDPAMQSRVIGPYRYSPVATLYDFAVTVAASGPEISGSSYRSISDALAYLKGQSAQNPRITITESGTYGLPFNNADLISYDGGAGRCLIEASVPVVIGNTSYLGDNGSTFRPRYDGLHLRGRNITLDMRFVTHIAHELLGEFYWFDGINVTLSGSGRNEYWRKGVRPIPWIARHGAWWTECNIENVKEPFVQSQLVRGCTALGGYGDVFTDSLCVVSNTVNDWRSNTLWQIDVPALSVSGPAGSTLSISSGNDANGRAIVAKVDGAQISQFIVGSGEAYFLGAEGDGYTVADVAAWLNTLPEWSANVLDDTRRASALSLEGTKGASFADFDVSANAVFATYFDLHTDWYAQNNAGPGENVIVAGNRSWDIRAQNIYVTGAIGAKDFVFINNTFDNEDSFNVSQLEEIHSHVIVAHNSSTTQGIQLRASGPYDPDTYCLLSNNAFPSIVWSATGTRDADLQIANNVLDAGTLDPTHAIGSLISGTKDTKFAKARWGDFLPAGELLSNLVTPVVSVDQAGRTRPSTGPAGAMAQAQSTAAIQEALSYGSVRFPPENGESKAGENGGFFLPNSNDLMRASAPGDTPLFNNAGSLAVLWKVPRAIYNGLRRAPVLLGNDRMTSGTSNRQLRLSFVTGADNGNIANVNKFRAILRGETGNGSLDLYSATVPTDFGDWLMPVIRFDGANFAIDVFDLASGEHQPGPPTAKPAGWAGIAELANELGIGIFRPGQFPQDVSDLFTNGTGYARGECAGVLFTETDGADADWREFALGGDPMSLWPTDVRAWFPMAEADTLDLSPRSNITEPVAYTADLVQLGTVYPGSSARRHSPQRYLQVIDCPDPALVGVYSATMRGDFRVTLSMAGQQPGAAIDAKFLDAGGFVQRDWSQVGVAVADGAVTIAIDLPPGIYRASFRVAGGDQCNFNGDIVVGPLVLTNGQSQCSYTFGLSLNEQDSAAPANFTFDPSVGNRTFVAAKSKVPGAATLQVPAVYRAADKPGIVGDGFIAAANKLAADIPSDWPIIIADVSVSGTSIADTLANGGSPDNRDMGDIYAITNMLQGRDFADRSIITAWAQFWHSSGSITAYSAAFMPPLLDGKTTAQVPTVDDYPYSGKAIHPGFPFVQFEPNRIIDITNSASSGDPRNEHLTRQDLRDGEARYAYKLGAPIDVHHLEQDTFTHPDPAERFGSAFVAECVAQSIKPVLGIPGGYTGPVSLEAAAFVDVTNTAIDVTFSGPVGFVLDALNGGALTGFEVGDDKDGFIADIIANDTVRLTKTTDAWPSGVAIKLKPGGPGNYGIGHDEAAFVDGALINAFDRCLVRGTGAPVAAIGGSTGTTSGNPEGDLIATMNSTGGQSAYHDYRSASYPDASSWISSDQSANGNAHEQMLYGFRRPGLGGEFDGTSLAIQTIAGGMFTVTMSFLKSDASTAGHFIGTNGASVQYSQGSNLPLPYTTLVDGTQVSTQGALHDALHLVGEKVVEIRSIDRTGQTELHIGRGSSSVQGTIRKVAVLDEAALGAQLGDARMLATSAVAT